MAFSSFPLQLLDFQAIFLSHATSFLRSLRQDKKNEPENLRGFHFNLGQEPTVNSDNITLQQPKTANQKLSTKNYQPTTIK
jgi:hypothetical protein